MSKKKPDRIKVSVTALDIKRGLPQIPECCPIARAVKRAGYRDVSVDPDECIIGKEFFLLPPKANKFVLDFDYDKDNAKLKPFTFTLRKKAQKS